MGSFEVVLRILRESVQFFPVMVQAAIDSGCKISKTAMFTMQGYFGDGMVRLRAGVDCCDQAIGQLDQAVPFNLRQNSVGHQVVCLIDQCVNLVNGRSFRSS